MGLPLLRSMQPGFKSFTSTSSLDFYVCWFLFMICYHYICFKRKQTLETYRNTYRKHTRKNTFGSKPPFRQIDSVSSVSSLSLLSYIKVLLCCIQVLSPSYETPLSSLAVCQPCSIKVNTTPYVWVLEPKGSAQNREVTLMRPIHGSL